MTSPNEEKYYSIFNEASDCIVIMDDMGCLKNVNVSLCRLLGYTRQELLNTNIADLIGPEQLEIDPVAYERINNREHVIKERQLQKKDGSVVEMEVNIKKVSENMIIAIAREITELRTAQKINVPDESKFRSAFENSDMGMLLVSTDGEFLQANKKFAQITGYSHEELHQMGFYNIMHPGDIEKGMSLVNDALQGRISTYSTEKRYIHKNKTIIWVNITSSVVADAMGQVQYFIKQVEDITEKKEAELKYKNLLEKSLVGIFIHKEGKKIKYVNSRMTEIFGYTESELLKKHPELLIHEDDLAIVRETIRKRFEDNAETTHYEVRGRRKDGTIIWLDIYGSLIVHHGEKAVIGNILDITERKKAEEDLNKINHDMRERVKELNCLYRVSELSNAPGKAIEDILQELIQIIPQSYHYPEFTSTRITFNGRTLQSKNFSDSKWKQNAPIKINNEIAGLLEVFYTREMPEKEEGPFLNEERSLINSIAEMLGSAAERKNAETSIKEQAERFQAIIENTKESIYLISPDYKIMQFNNTGRKRLHISRGMDVSVGTDFRQFLCRDTTDIFCSMFEDCLNGKHRKEETRAQGISGDYFWFQSTMSPVYQNGELIGVTLLIENIDDRKRSEAVLRESEDKFRSIVEQNLVGIYIIQEGKLVYVNPGFEKTFGYSKNELLYKMSFDGIVHEDDLELVTDSYISRINNKKTKTQYSFRAIRKDGTILHVEVIATMISYNGKPAVIGTLINITNRIAEEKRTNQAVLDAQERERLQIGMELHDNVNQILAGSVLLLSTVKKSLDDKEVATGILDKLKEYNMEAINELRRLSHQLAPSVESDTTLNDKITSLISSLKIEEKLSVSVHIDEFEKPLDNNTQLAFYRILQEQLGNIMKYAKASTVEIIIRSIGHAIRLEVSDNGKGFDLNTKKEGIGLENIRRRAEIMNGKVEIISSPGKGCKVKVQIPTVPVTQ